MSYIDRLKQKIVEEGPGMEATKVTKASSVPFVASPPAPFPRISAAADDRIGKMIATLDDLPGLRYAVEAHDDLEPDAIILTLAIRGKGSCELRIPKSRFDAFALLEMLEKHTRPEALH